MLEELLRKPESKTLEFKENAQSLPKIIQTLIAFANTAGGTLVIGITDRTKEIIGVEDILKEEARISNAIADCITPVLIPTIQFSTFRGKDILIISIPHCIGPFHLKSEKAKDSTYVRVGSSNRLADSETVQEIQRSREKRTFDELPNHRAKLEDLDLKLAKNLFAKVKKKFTEKTAQSLGIIVPYQGELFPSNGGILLFGMNVRNYFSNAQVRLVRFLGTTKAEVLDHQDVDFPLVTALEPILAFIRRNTKMAARIGDIHREDIPEYPSEAVKEAVTNALLHADYAITNASIQIAIYDDRMEIINPGGLLFGLDLETAIAGVSQLRNKVIGRVFRELKIIEQWGSGLGRMIRACEKHNLPKPRFEEIGNFFKVTLFSGPQINKRLKAWDGAVIEYLKQKKKITAQEAQQLWNVTSRTTSTRLQEMLKSGQLAKIGLHANDPQAYYVLRRH